MATKVLTLQQRYQDKTKIQVTDVTFYGTISPDRRQDFAGYMFGAKFDKNQTLTYSPDAFGSNNAPLSSLGWFFDYLGDSAYRFFYFIVPLWDNATNYLQEQSSPGQISQYADIIYEVDSLKYYKAIQDNNNVKPGVTASWEDYWEIYDPVNLIEYVKTTQMDVVIFDDIVAYAYESCIRKKTERQADKELCGACSDSEEFMETLRAEFMLNAAKASIFAQKPQMASAILEQANKKFCSC